MAPIERSRRALSIGAIGFAWIRDLNQKLDLIWFHKFKSNQIKSWEKGVKSNQIKSRGHKLASNQIKSKGPKIHPNQIKSWFDFCPPLDVRNFLESTAIIWSQRLRSFQSDVNVRVMCLRMVWSPRLRHELANGQIERLRDTDAESQTDIHHI